MTTLPRYLVLTALLAASSLGADFAHADSAKESQLEARVTELEKQLQAVLAELKAQKTAPAAPAVAAGPAKPGAPAPIQDTTITPGAAAGTKFTFGGFVKLEGLYTKTSDGELADSSTARDLYIPGLIPVGAKSEGTDLNGHAQFSRLWFEVNSPTSSGGKAGAHVEFDFFGSSLGDQRATNTYGATMRHAYAYWDHWLVGQTWSNFMDVNALTESTDLIGPTDGTVFVRQPQLRYTNGPWSFSLENPESTITPFHGGTRIASDDNNLPDLTAKYTWKGDWGSMSLGGLLRQIRYQTVGTNAIDDSVVGAAASFTGKYMFGKDDLRWGLTGGRGFGRYVALNFANDAVVDATGNLDALRGWAGFVGYRHLFNDTVRGNLFYAAERYDNDLATGGANASKSSSSLHANLFYTPAPKVDVGVEFIHARRELESGADGDENRVHLVAKYSF